MAEMVSLKSLCFKTSRPVDFALIPPCTEDVAMFSNQYAVSKPVELVGLTTLRMFASEEVVNVLKCTPNLTELDLICIDRVPLVGTFPRLRWLRCTGIYLPAIERILETFPNLEKYAREDRIVETAHFAFNRVSLKASMNTMREHRADFSKTRFDRFDFSLRQHFYPFQQYEVSLPTSTQQISVETHSPPRFFDVAKMVAKLGEPLKIMFISTVSTASLCVQYRHPVDRKEYVHEYILLELGRQLPLFEEQVNKVMRTFMVSLNDD